MFRRLIFVALLLLLPGAFLLARQPTEEAGPADHSDQPVVGNLQHVGWGLQGAQGRHYFFGGLAVADYTRQGKHRVVTLAEETASEQADPKFLYYRELGDGHRWAVAKSAERDRTYPVYFQSRGEPGVAGRSKWTLFHRAKLIEDSRFPEDRRATAETQPGGRSSDAPRTRSPQPADVAPTLSRPEIVLQPDVPCCGR